VAAIGITVFSTTQSLALLRRRRRAGADSTIGSRAAAAMGLGFDEHAWADTGSGSDTWAIGIPADARTPAAADHSSSTGIGSRAAAEMGFGEDEVTEEAGTAAAAAAALSTGTAAAGEACAAESKECEPTDGGGASAAAAERARTTSPALEFEQRDPPSLKILTQNVWCHYPMSFVPGKQCRHALRGRNINERLDILAEHIAEEKYDIVFIQELFIQKMWPFTSENRDNFRFFAEKLRQAGLIYRTNPEESLDDSRYVGQNAGVAIFSRWPMKDHDSQDFEKTAESMNTKGFVTTVVEVPVLEPEKRSPSMHEGGAGGGARAAVQRQRSFSTTYDGPKISIQIVSAHLDARHWPSKQAQVTQIKDYFLAIKAQRQAEDDTRLIICGDLNICPQQIWDDGSQYDHLISEFSHLGLTDLWSAGESERIPTEGVGTSKAGTLDHIFYEPPLWKEVLSKNRVLITKKEGSGAGKSISDHYGLEVELAL